jgi:SAM-dependent methyltransferase
MRRQPVDRCPVCGSRDRSKTMRLTDLSGKVSGSFVSVVCPCGTRWLEDPIREDDIAGAYGDDYYTFEAPVRQGQVKEYFKQLRRRLVIARYATAASRRVRRLSALMPGYPPPGPAEYVLDVGCGSGERLLQLTAAGWRCAGVDASEHAAATCRDRGLDVRAAQAAALPFAAASFDSVLMSHSLEHCPEPRDAVREVGRVLKPGGTFVVTTPNATSPAATLLRGRWVNWDAPRHYLVFGRRALCGLLREEGFEIVRVRGSSTGWSWSASLQSLAEARGWAATGRAAGLLRLPSRFVAFALDFTDFADEIEVVAKNRPRPDERAATS